MSFKQHVQDYENRNGLKNFQKFLDEHSKEVVINNELEEKLKADKETVDEYVEGFLNAQLYNMLYDKKWVEENEAFDFNNPTHELFYSQYREFCGLA